MKECCLNFEKAGNWNEASFATSPPYFDFTGCDDLEKIICLIRLCQILW